MSSSYMPTYAVARQIALTWSKSKLQKQAYELRQATPQNLRQFLEENQGPPLLRKFEFVFPAGVEDPRSLSDILHQDLALYARLEHRIMLRVHEAVVRSESSGTDGDCDLIRDSYPASARGRSEQQHDGEEEAPLTPFQIGFPPGVEDPRSLSAIRKRQRLWRQRFLHSARGATQMACDW